jgi:hypothetical protein
VPTRFPRNCRDFSPSVNTKLILFVLVDMTCNGSARPGSVPGDAGDAVRELYSCHASALHRYVQRFCRDKATADDIVQETFIRAWRHLPQLTADQRPIRPATC